MANNPVQLTPKFLAFYAAALAIEHGIFEFLQGGSRGRVVLIQAIGPPCQPDQVWHACFPALSVLPDLKVAGSLVILTALALAIWAALGAKQKRYGLVIIGLSLVLLPLGGGFVPVWVGLLGGIAAIWSHRIAPRKFSLHAKVRPRLITFWYILAGSLLAWFPLSWLAGSAFGEEMLRLSGLFFGIFDLLLPFSLVVVGVLSTSFLHEEGPSGVS